MRKVPFVPQLNSTECGVCVLTMILRYFGAYYSIHEIRKQLATGRDGVSIRRLINSFQNYGIDAVAYRGDVDCTSVLPLPAIATWKEDHYVIVERINRKYIYIVDSNLGRLKITCDEFIKSYSGVIILLTKTIHFKKRRKHSQIKNSFFPMLKHYREKFIILIILSLLTQLSTLFVPISIKKLIDDLISINIDSEHVYFFIGSMLTNSMFLYLKNHYLTIFGVDIDRDVNKKLLEKLLTVKYDFYDNKNNADIIYALDNVGCIKNIYLDNILGSIFDFCLTLFIIAYLFYTNPIFCIIILIALLPNVILLIFTDKPIQRDIRLMIKEYKNIYGQQTAIIYSILGIKTSSIENCVFAKWIESYNLYYKKEKDYQTKINAFKIALTTMINLLPIVVLVFAILFSSKGFMTIGGAMAFYTMTNMLFGSVNIIINNIRNLRDNLNLLERIEEIMQYDKEMQLERMFNKIDIDGDININNISFKYSEDGEYILKNISCTIKKGSKVAIIGDSGSGKSTLLKVLSGLYKLENGMILYNHNQMDDCNMASIRKQIGFIAQNVWPLNQSIKEYMLLGLTNISMDDIENACKIANIHEEIMRMPMKYHTIISETGKNISGGQCQRIMLARMVLLNPQILFLDEATNALDDMNENKILDYFFKKKCTIVMVTHKLEYIKKCDEILVMKDGRLFTSGKYDELVKQGYRNMLT